MSKQNSVTEDDDDSSTSDILDTRNDEGWQDVEKDVIDDTVVSLFDSKTFPNVVAMFEYCRSEYTFDIWAIQREKGLDFLGLVKLVNYVRNEVKKGNLQPDVTQKSKFDDEMLLMPVMEDDAVLYSLEEILQGNPKSTLDEVEELRDQLASVQSQFAAYRNDIRRLSKIDLMDVENETVRISSSKLDAERAKIDNNYFSGYSYNTIHESMLKDRVRTDAYRDFIYDNKDVFRDKVVLDVGCGTGILSMFCAKAGAKLVIAVDNSDIVEKAKQNVRANDLDEKITCIKGKIEEVSLPVAKVDIIVSEWMGYCLLFESMLDSVIFARDKFLAPNGLMVPSHVDIKAAPLADSELQASYIDFWKDVYGFDMTAMLDRAHEEALVRLVDSKELCADSTTLLRLDLHIITVKELDFSTSCTFTIKDEYQNLEGFALWFDTFFLPSRSASVGSVKDAKAKGLVAFSTGPAPEEPTHWQQTICLIKNSDFNLTNSSTEKALETHFMFKKRLDSHRSLDIGIKWSLDDKKGSQDWFLE